MNAEPSIPVFHFSTVESTNDLARELLTNESMVIVVAEEQTKGRGRHGKIWEGAAGANLYCSVGLRQERTLSPAETASYQAIGVLAVLDTLKELEVYCCLKYPNDVIIKDPAGIIRKICGILVEHDYLGAAVQTTIIGIGINNGQTEFPPVLAASATSLALIGVNITNWELLEILQKHLQIRLNDPAVMETWKNELQIEGKHMTMHDGKESFIVVKVLDDGTLLADNGEENILIHSGDTFRYDIDCGQQ